MSFKILPQSGLFQPNSIKGLLVWIDSSELGTLSRSNTTATAIYDKAPGGNFFVSPTRISRPKILQGFIRGQTVLKFQPPTQFVLGEVDFTIDQVVVIVAANGLISINNAYCYIDDGFIRVPHADLPDTQELAELLIYDKKYVDELDLEFLVNYLTKKWYP